MKCTVLALAALAASFVLGDTPSREPADTKTPSRGQGTFTFVRVEYDSVGGYGESYYDFDGRRWQRWETDYPEAEENFLIRIEELTTIQVGPEPISLRLTDPRLYDYPFIYMSDVGWQWLSEEEVADLRAYLNRGGFLWIDDFWGDAEWINLEENMQRVFPELMWRRIPDDHPILNMVFSLKECPQVPAKSFWDGWRETYDMPRGHREPTGGIPGVREVNFLGLFDDDNRLMAVATHNSDIGDGWERESENLEFFEIFSTKSYAIGVNIIVYALTH